MSGRRTVQREARKPAAAECGPGFGTGGMQVFDDLADWQAHRRTLRGSVGFVPTMGALHEGHASLLARSLAENDTTVLSIYLNPTQFNNPDDLSVYPRTLEQDLARARTLGVDAVLLPNDVQMYPDGYRYRVVEEEFSRILCGAHRPGHFDGVLTVVMKLLNIVRPHRAYFGEKDYQQYLLVRDMARAFFLPVEIVPCETVRAPDGLALSSRNANLDAEGRRRAAELHAAIRSEADDETVAARLSERGFAVDYVVTRDGRRFAAATLQCAGHSVRLIDNVPLSGG